MNKVKTPEKVQGTKQPGQSEKNPNQPSNARPTKAADKPPASTSSGPTIVVKMLPIDKLHPSGRNPNRMKEEDRLAYREEVRLKGKPPRPIVVRPVETDYEVIDGEQTLGCCKEAGLVEVPCEILEVDNFEAMRLSYSLNRRGDNDPVLLGRLFDYMKNERKLSDRALAAELRVSPNTIGNYLAYSKAAALRNSCAPTDADEQIGALSVRQVVAYLELKKLKKNADEWLDAGASLKEADKLLAPKESAKKVDDSTTQPDQNEGDDSDTDAQEGSHADTLDDEEDGEASDDETAAPEATLNDDDGAHTDVDDATPDDNVDAPAVPPADMPTKADDPFDDVVLDVLEETWARANLATRRKFLSGVMADPDMQKFARQMVKQGS